MIKKISAVVLWIFFSLLFLLPAIITGACDWYNIRFGVTFEEILFTITSPLAGADTDFLFEALEYITPYLKEKCLTLIFVLLLTIFLYRNIIKLKFNIFCLNLHISVKTIHKICCFIFAINMLTPSLEYAVDSLSLNEFVERKMQSTTIYEDYYVNPKETNITHTGELKNIIYIYLESMESTYASVEDGGAQTINYIPKLTQLANENTSFSDTTLLGGAHVTFGSTWTMGALFSSTTGIPFAFPIEGNSMNSMDDFASGATALGDILNQFRYTQKFLCGSDGTFAGRQAYFEQHGNYEVLDYYYAIEQGYIPEDYYVWWGYEDTKLYEIAKEELLKLSKNEQPFNFTMLTVDPHHVDGYVCENCETNHGHQLANVLECGDKQIYDFILWCQEQDFYDNTVIVITGDHLRMDSSLVAEADTQGTRRIYNCIINSDTTASLGTDNRIFTTLDLFPTTLSAMGFHIDGNRLGLGTDLFSDTPTLAEELGVEYLENELGKYSNFYVKEFE